MAVPTGKRSRARTRQKRSINDRKSPPGVTYCTNCKAPKQPHRACGHCGYYDARRGVVMETPFSEGDQD